MASGETATISSPQLRRPCEGFSLTMPGANSGCVMAVASNASTLTAGRRPLTPEADHILAVSEALEKFHQLDPKRAELVKLRYFVGLTFEQAGEVMGISEPTAKRYWSFARAWLYEEIRTTR